MSRHRTFAAAFVATIAVLVPAAWHGTDATIEKDGKHVRPLQKQLYIDGARVTVDVDHALITTGDAVVAKLRAFSDTPRQVAVDLTVMQSDDAFGSRVAAPPSTIDKEHFTLDATPDGGKVVSTKLVMKPNSGTPDKLDWFRIFVSKRGEKVDVYGGGGYSGEDDDKPAVAAVSILGWSSNDFDIAIKPKGKITAGQPFEVAVRIENTSAATIRHAPYIHLGTSVGLYGIEEGEDFEIADAPTETEEGGPDYDKKFRRGDVVVERFTVTPKRADVTSVTFIASAYAWTDEPGTISEGAMDARTFKVAPAANPEQKPAAVAAK